VLTLDQLGISEEDWNQTPASVRVALMFLLQQNQRLENRCATYQLQVQRLEAEMERLKKLELEVAELRERLGQNSQNSSKPPSSDPPSVSRPNNRRPSGRKRGGQPGHPGRARKLLPPEQGDTVVKLCPTACCKCGHLLLGDDPDPVRHQVSEIPPVKAEVTEYQQHRLTCAVCGEVTAAQWPDEMPRGNFGPRAQAVVGYLTGRLALSHRDVVEAMEALHGLSLSLGSVSTIQDHVSKALEQPVGTARQYVHRQPVNQVDETIWPEGEKQKWLWIGATPEVTVFRILAGCGQAQAKEVIGKGYQGIINTDRYAGYHWMDAHRRQLCWAHLKREFLAIKGRVGMFYFAGHGVQVNGANYLIPIGAVIKGEAGVKYEAVDAGFVLAQMEDARNRSNIVVLDACRNNPFARSFRSSSGGLASIDAPVGTLIAYATAPGRTASDGNGRNGLYTKELLAAMRVPGLRIEDIFKQTRSEVRRQSNNQQIPWESSSIEGDFYFSTSGVGLGPLAPAPTPTASVPPYPKIAEAYFERGVVYFGKPARPTTADRSAPASSRSEMNERRRS
jgi:transposase